MAPHSMRSTRFAHAIAPRRGAATLMVVMVLFFLVSLVAAYTSRNLIFEQKTSANQVRSSQAFEAAEAGVDWALSQLNAGRTTAQCLPSTVVADGSLRERYLDIDPTSGLIAVRTASGGGSVEPSCVLDTSNDDPAAWRWSCRCPATTAATAALTPPVSGRPTPAFAVRWCNTTGNCTATPPPVGTRAGVVRLEVNGCTRLDATCLAFGAGTESTRGEIGEGVASVFAVIALRSALASPPAAAITLRGQLLDPLGGALLALRNAERTAQGVTLQAGSNVSFSGLSLTSLPGTPGDRSVVEFDTTLVQAALPAVSLTAEDRFFVAFFGMRPDTYRRQPAVLELDCSAGCDAAAVNAVVALNPGRVLWLRGAAGGLTIDADIGSAADPVLMVVEGDITMTGPVTFTGLLYGRKTSWDWTVSANASIVGAAVGEGDLRVGGGGSTTSVTYDAAVVARLRTSHGSFVRVPGGWRDFRGT